jgi:hypothetical protein
MIVSHRHRYIFIKTRKTAGTSIEIALSAHCGPDDIMSPISKEDELVRRGLGYPGPQHHLKTPGEYTLRDWWDRLRGEQPRRFYNHAPASVVKAMVGGEVWDSYFKFCFDRNPFDKAISKYYWTTKRKKHPPDMNQWLQNCPTYKISNWDMYSLEGDVAMDFVGRFEHLQDDLQQAFGRIGLQGAPELPRTKTGTRKSRAHYRDLLTDETRQRLERDCAREIELLGYSW